MAKIDGLEFGITVKHCAECEHKNNHTRDNLLVTAGARAAYLNDAGCVDLPNGVEGETQLALFIAKMVDIYMLSDDRCNFDEYIETSLTFRYPLKKGE